MGDGDFSVVKLRVSLAEGVVLMSRCPRNRALFFTTTGEGWPEKEMLPVGMGNAVAGSLRG